MRHLPDALKEHFDALNLIVSDETDFLIEVAKSCIGITEVGGDNRGPLVELFQGSVGRPAGQSWCLDYLQACIAYTEITLSVKSLLPATESCLDLWNQARLDHSVKPPERGDLIIWQMGNTSHGHVGIIVGQDSLRYQTVEGNTSDSSDINREGDGVYFKNRAKMGSVTFREKGFLRVFK